MRNVNIRLLGNVEVDEVKKLSNSDFLASVLVQNLDLEAKKYLVTQLFSNNGLKVEILDASEPTKFIIKCPGRNYCISYFQLLTNPDKVVRYIKSKL